MEEHLMQVFENNEFGKIEVVQDGDKFYFPATKCAKILGYKNPQKAVRDHCIGVNESFIPSAGGTQKNKDHTRRRPIQTDRSLQVGVGTEV